MEDLIGKDVRIEMVINVDKIEFSKNGGQLHGWYTHEDGTRTYCIVPIESKKEEVICQ